MTETAGAGVLERTATAPVAVAPDGPQAGSIAWLLRRRDLRAFLLGQMTSGLAGGGLSVVLGFHLYALTHNPLDLGWLGLAEAVPAIGLLLFGGHAADRFSRRRLTLATLAAQAALAALAGGLALGTACGTGVPALILATCALRGTVRAVGWPAMVGLQAQVIPPAQALRAVSVLGAAAHGSALAGPVTGGLLYAAAGPG